MSQTAEKLFRSAALKQLNSPEDLDRLVRITSAIGWVATFALAPVLVGGIGWSIRERLRGTGLMPSHGGRVIGRRGESDSERDLAYTRG